MRVTAIDEKGHLWGGFKKATPHTGRIKRRPGSLPYLNWALKKKMSVDHEKEGD